VGVARGGRDLEVT